MTDKDAVEKPKENTSLSLPTRIFIAIFSRLMAMSMVFAPILLVWVIVLVIFWGAATRMIVEAWEWSYGLFGF